MNTVPTRTTTKELLGAVAGMLASDVDDAIDLMTALEVLTPEGSAERAGVLLALAQDFLGGAHPAAGPLDERLTAVTAALSRTALIDAVRHAARSHVYEIDPTPRTRHLHAVR